MEAKLAFLASNSLSLPTSQRADSGININPRNWITDGIPARPNMNLFKRKIICLHYEKIVKTCYSAKQAPKKANYFQH